MKRNLAYIVLSIILALSLSACADTMMDDDSSVNNVPTVTNAPVITPDTNEGRVDDNNGVIGDNDGIKVSDKPIIDIDETEGAEVNTQPKASTAPTATAKP